MKSLLELVLRRHRPDVVALSAWLDGQLDPAAAKTLEAHIATCARCRAHSEELRSVRAMLRATPAPEPRRSFRLTPDMIATAPASRPVPTPRAVRFAPYVGVAATLAFAVVVGADLYSSGGSSSSSATRVSESAQSASQAGPASGLTAPESGDTTTNKGIEPPSATPGVAAAPYAPTDLPPAPATGAGVNTGTAAAGGEATVRDNGTPPESGTAPAFESAAQHDENGGSGNNRTALHVIEAVIAAIALAAGAVAIGARVRERGASR